MRIVPKLDDSTVVKVYVSNFCEVKLPYDFNSSSTGFAFAVYLSFQETVKGDFNKQH